MKSKLYAVTEFTHFSAAWNKLNQQTHDQAILSADFIQSLIKHFFTGTEQLVVVKNSEHIIFIGFFQRLGFGRWQTVMPSQAPLGLWLALNGRVEQKTLAAISAVLPGPVLQLDLLQADSRFLSLDSSIQQHDYIETGNKTIPEHYDEFFNSISKNLRQNCNKAYNRAAREGDSFSTQLFTKRDDVVAAVVQYGEIESNSWKAEQGTAISAINEQGLFYQDMMGQLAQRDAACVWYFLVSGQVAAVDLCVINNGHLIILKTTFDEHFACYSPALLLKMQMLKYYADHPELGIKNIEFYGKAMDWHKRLHSELRPIVHLSWQRTRLLQWLVRKLKLRK
jgi:hypothetical protein